MAYYWPVSMGGEGAGVQVGGGAWHSVPIGIQAHVTSRRESWHSVPNNMVGHMARAGVGRRVPTNQVDVGR